jgi:hypothetical protein
MFLDVAASLRQFWDVLRTNRLSIVCQYRPGEVKRSADQDAGWLIPQAAKLGNSRLQ